MVCFFIAPIGDEGSDTRERTDKLMEYIVAEAVDDFGYSVERADQLDEPGSITSQVIQRTTQSDLVIADLTGHNPNVFYELAVRHATGNPCIQLIKSSESIPFDISDLRTIKYGLGVEEADQARDQIRAQLEAMEEDDPEFDNPISQSAEMKSLQESEDPTDQNLAELLQRMSRIDSKISNIEYQMNESEPESESISVNHNIEKYLNSFDSNLESPEDEKGDTVTLKKAEEAAKEMGISENELISMLDRRGVSVVDG